MKTTEIQELLRESLRSTRQAHCILTIFQYAEITAAPQHIVDDAVLSCALEGVTALLERAAEKQEAIEEVFDAELTTEHTVWRGAATLEAVP